MIKREKEALVASLKPLFEEGHLCILDCEGLKSNQVYMLRYRLHQEDIQCRQIPNALLRILLIGTVYAPLLDVLQRSSLLLFIKEDPKKAAQIISSFRKEQNTDKPLLKGALAHDALLIGEKSLKELMSLKSQKELLGDIVELLQSPAQILLNALQSPANKLCALLNTIDKK